MKISVIMDSYDLLANQNYWNVCKTHFSKWEIFLEGSTKKKIRMKQERELQNKEGKALPKRGLWYVLVFAYSILCIFQTRCFYLFNLGTCNLIRSSGFLQLPHQLTLSKYTGFALTGSSFNPDIIKRLIDEISITDAKEYEKNVMLLFDEMKVKAELIFTLLLLQFYSSFTQFKRNSKRFRSLG